MTQRGTVHSRHVDEEMAARAREYRNGQPTRSNDWSDPELPVADEPGGLLRTPPSRVGTPFGMTEDDVEGRSELARFLPTSIFPTNERTIRAVLIDANAPDELIAEIRRLPEGLYSNVTDVWSALGHGVEEARD